MKHISDVVNEMLNVKSLRIDIEVLIIRSVVHNASGWLVVFEDGTEYKLDEWDDGTIDAFCPGGCLLRTPDGSETVCSPFFVENFLL